MTLGPTRRFSSRVADYVRYRPSYPDEVIRLLERECGLRPASAVADIGSGTGILSKLLLDFGCEVFGVEPNPDMRIAGERFLAGCPRFHSVEGEAEQTGLPPASIDLATAAQAFHWFDPERSRTEFRRILRPPGYVALLWNERAVKGDFLEGYEDLLHRFAPEYAVVDHRRIRPPEITAFFGHDGWKEAAFENRQDLDLDGVRGRLRSSSYAPLPGSAAFDPMMQELDRLFAAFQQDGRVAFLYETNVYYGSLDSE